MTKSYFQKEATFKDHHGIFSLKFCDTYMENEMPMRNLNFDIHITVIYDEKAGIWIACDN